MRDARGDGDDDLYSIHCNILCIAHYRASDNLATRL